MVFLKAANDIRSDLDFVIRNGVGILIEDMKKAPRFDRNNPPDWGKKDEYFNNANNICQSSLWKLMLYDLCETYYGIFLDSSSNNNLTGSTAYLNDLGIRFWGSENNVLSNNNASNNNDGICVDSSSNNALAGNTAYSNNHDGISLWLSDNNVLVCNNASNNEESGIVLISCSNNNLTANSASSNSEYGISLAICSGNILSGNIASNNLYNFDVYGDSFSGLYNHIDTSNTVDGKPIYYLIRVANAVYDARTNAGTIYLINCNNITIRDLDLTKNGNAVFSFNTINSKIQNITASNSERGIHLYSSSNNTINGNTVCSNNDDGIYLEYSDNNTLSGNNASSSSNGAGISLSKSSDNTIARNSITSNLVGIKLYQSDNNVITLNNVSNNLDRGIYLIEARNDALFHNSFINNTIQAYVEYAGSMNTWDNGYPSGGNFWSDYIGKDDYSGPYQNETGNDGIGDTPYTIFPNNTDKYPLMKPWLVVTIAGDINRDGTVDIYDAIVLAGAYSSTPGSPNWNANVDLNSDNIVDIYDAILLANNFGKTA
jgi:parallel beta-helix repeat protein